MTHLLTQDQTVRLLRDLEPVAEANLNRHLGVAKEWFPHEYVPWSEGQTFDGLLGGEPWSIEQSKVPDVARTALFVNLLTDAAYAWADPRSRRPALPGNT